MRSTVLVLTCVLFGILLGGCDSHSRFQATQDMQTHVNLYFNQKFAMGDWRYQGSFTSDDRIDAYILIPHKLNLDPDEQQQYLQQSVCPDSENKEFWLPLKGVSVSVHIYSFTMSLSENAQCYNPFAQ